MAWCYMCSRQEMCRPFSDGVKRINLCTRCEQVTLEMILAERQGGLLGRLKLRGLIRINTGFAVREQQRQGFPRNYGRHSR